MHRRTLGDQDADLLMPMAASACNIKQLPSLPRPAILPRNDSFEFVVR